MGVLNVTPDSFSDGGHHMVLEEAVEWGGHLVAEGADIVDVGGESSRPGAQPVSEAEELARVVPVIEALAGSVRLSVDTVKPAVARAAVTAGATLVNDISGSLWTVAADLGVGWVAMHMQGSPPDMQERPHYHDVAQEVREFLLARAQRATAAGVEEVWIDPGIGFGKSIGHNLDLLASIPDLVMAARDRGYRTMVGTSRKGFLGAVAAPEGAPPLPVTDRLEGSLATAVWCIVHGVDMVRAHDVAHHVRAAALVGVVRREGALGYRAGPP